MRCFLLNREVIVVYDLDGGFKLVQLRLHQLLRAPSQKVQVVLHRPRLHNPFPFFLILLFPLLNDFPQFIAQDIASLVQLILSLVILA